jgi:outer membrane protein TolC
MRTLLLVGKFVFISCLAVSQSVVLEDYIRQGIKSNLSLQQQTIQLEKAVNSIAIARSNLALKITFAPTYSLAAGGRKLDFPIGDLLNPVYTTLNQLTQGGNFPQVENVNVQFAPNNFHETVVRFQYPIFNSDIKYNILIQEGLLQTETAKRKVIEYELRNNIRVAYYQYLQSLEGIEVLNSAKTLLGKFVSFNQKLVKNQVALKDVVLSAEYEVSKIKQQIAVAEKNNKMAKSYVNFLLNRELENSLEVDTSFANQLPQVRELAFLKQSALRNRPEFETLRTGILVNETAIQMAERSAKLPQVFVGGNAGFQGFGYQFKDQGFGILQLGMQWDLYHGKEKQRKIEEAKINKRIAESKVGQVQQQVQLQVAQAYYEFIAAEETFAAAKDGVRQAEGVLKIVDSRYRNGTAIYIEYLKAQNDVQTAQQMASLTKYDLWIKKATLDKVSGVE